MQNYLRNLVFAISLGVAVPALPLMAEEKSVETEAPERAKAKIADMAWLEGEWVGTGINGHPAGEAFSFAGDNQMVGYFWQLGEDGTIRLHELITIVPDGESLVMRLKHFNADLTGWEEKGGENALEFPLKQRSDTRWVFGPVTFTIPAPTTLDVSVKVRQSEGKIATLDFSYDRAVRK